MKPKVMDESFLGPMREQLKQNPQNSALIDGLVSAAAERLLGAALDVLQVDGHQWSTRPCSTCQAVSAIAKRPFGCVLYAQQKRN